MYYFVLEQGPKSSSCEDGNELSGLSSIADRDFLIILRPRKEVQRTMQMRRLSFCVFLHCQRVLFVVIHPA